MLALVGCNLIRTQKAEVETVRPSPEVEKELVETARRINQAFIRGDLNTLASYVRDDFTMIHGHMKRIENKREAVSEWQGLFAKLYGNTAIVLFNYEHPRLVAGRLGTERGKAIYVFLREGGRWTMVHCTTVADASGHGGGMP
jgi:ketosteroid isomerase-like protein